MSHLEGSQTASTGVVRGINLRRWNVARNGTLASEKTAYFRLDYTRDAVVASLAFALTLTGAYHTIKRIPIAGETGWDYIRADTAARRLYLPHGVEVVVIDLDSGAIVGTVTGLRDAHGVAVAPEINRGFADATDPGSVTIFDLKTLTTQVSISRLIGMWETSESHCPISPFIRGRVGERDARKRHTAISTIWQTYIL